MSAPMTVTRAQVLAHRVRAQQLDRGSAPAGTSVLALGIPDSPYGSGILSLAARGLADTSRPDAGSAGAAHPADADPGDGGLVLLWSVRGTPHLHRPADLPGLAAALWPRSDADATARIATTAIREGARLGVEAVRVTAQALRDVVRHPMPKGEVSSAVTSRIPDSLSFWCGPCDARHVSGGLLQHAGIFGAVRLVLGGGTSLAPLEGMPYLPDGPGPGAADVIADYLRTYGPAGPAEAAAYLGTTQREVRAMWPTGLVRLDVDGAEAWIPADTADALTSAPAPRLVRLLPAGDCWLRAQDRELLVPDAARRKQIWRATGSPGVVLVDGEVTGTWRTRKQGRRLDITVEPFGPAYPARIRAAIDAEADLVAACRQSTAEVTHTP